MSNFPYPTSEIEDLRAEVLRLRAQVALKDETIEFLLGRVENDPRNRPFSRIPIGSSQDPGELVGALEAAYTPEATHE